MRHPSDRLAALPDAEFAAFAERLGGVWPEYDATASPVTPDGTVELSLVRERPDGPSERAVVRLRRGRVTLEDVNDFAVFAAERGLSFAVLATVDEVSKQAADRARAAPVELYDGVGLVALARDAGIGLPDAEDAPDTADEDDESAGDDGGSEDVGDDPGADASETDDPDGVDPDSDPDA
ncbi:restriction endonuclease [Halobaculum sp. EA56]|uniref:restriction endonuclease n=1 Tax=Halobaculum sp. EA56 TaxID=3421648 RepID=UPI003EBB4C39